jgi:outer membrane protein assembly factor BamB
MIRRVAVFAVIAAIVALFAACGSSGNGDNTGASGGSTHRERDPHVVPNPHDYEEDPGYISPPTVTHPIYECAHNVTIKNFIAGATLNVFINGAPAPNPTVIGTIPEIGVNFDVGTSFVAGQVVTATQTFMGVTSGPSAPVPVTSHTADYPMGLPRPRLFLHPLRHCGHAVLVEDVVPGSVVEIVAENPLGGGGFGPPAVVGSFNASTEWGWNWTGVSPEFELGARITARAKLCMDNSPVSLPEITEEAPSPMPAASVEAPVIEGQTILRLWGPATGTPPEHGVILSVFNNGTGIGSTAAPGGAPHLFGIAAATLGSTYTATQKLCVEGGPGPGTPTQPCSDLPAPTIKPPLPGDTQIVVTSHIPGARILVFAGAEEVGDSSGDVINLKRALVNGETVKVMQKLGDCVSPFRYQTVVECAIGDAPRACSTDWPAFRHNGLRNAQQVNNSVLADPYQVKTLTTKFNIGAPDGGAFTASPVVFGGKVFIGTDRGHLFAFNAMTGAMVWQYPPAAEPALTSGFNAAASCANPSSAGIASSVAIARVNNETDAVILAAPDPGRPSDPGGKFGSGNGSGRLFAINANSGALIWKTSAEVARMTGFHTPPDAAAFTELHEQIGYSSPLVIGNRIYVGLADHCDNPIQNGKVIAVDLNTGGIDAGFNFSSTSTRGGGIWTFISGGLADGLVTTTGNVASANDSEPRINNALSMVRLDPTTGMLQGKIQPVPFELDGDPDWSAGATLVASRCGNVSVSTMKDGWSYGGNMGPPLDFRWQYPPVAYPFPTTDKNHHDDIRYHRAGASWNDLYFTMTGGEDIVGVATVDETFNGYRLLHALDVCDGFPRWIAGLEAFTAPIMNHHSWALGPPTVTRGIVYVGTNLGFLVAIADPSVWPANGSRCTNSRFTVADCVANGFAVVPQPAILKSIDLGSGAIVRNEPAIANGNLYVATSGGRLFRLAPGASP